MIVIPAIDIRKGNSVRLKQGLVERETIHSNDPFETAKLWKSKGAKRIHIVDLDAAIEGQSQNTPIIKKICSELNIEVEVGGGLRDMEKIGEVFEAGASFAVLGTIILQKPEILKEAAAKYGACKIIAALDVKNDKVAVKGWKEISQVSTDDFIASLKKYGIDQIIYTDISKDGMLSGPNFEGLKKLLDRKLKIIVSGGIKTIDDLIKVKGYESGGAIGAIVGSAIYSKDFDLQKAIETFD
jgi:phosphoribosylformimino-5-aminoimidazole carboxamide ribotide isomerase